MALTAQACQPGERDRAERAGERDPPAFRAAVEQALGVAR